MRSFPIFKSRKGSTNPFLLPQFAKKKPNKQTNKQIQQQNCLELIKKRATNARP